MKLRIAEDLTLPVEVVTEKLAFLGRTGSGKTYGAMKLAELMLDAGAQIVALDPVGVWYGLRIGGPWNVYIFGGLHGDFPLEPTGGALVADLIIDRGISVVLDVSQFIPSEQQRFAKDFAHRFFHRKKSAPSAVHLFMEECQEFIPENPSGLEAQTLGEFQRLWKLGRNFGIGGSLISQRPQEIAKKALNMSGTMFAFQMTGPQERKAVKLWVADKGIAVDIESVLQRLSVGEPHVESPTFLEVSKTVRILPKLTADVSSTPKVGARAKEQPLTPVDLEKLKTEMAGTIERSKADDPKELRKQIAQLKQQIVELEKRPAESKTVEISILTNDDRQLFRDALGFWSAASSALCEIGKAVEKQKLLLEKVIAIPDTRKLAAPPQKPTANPGYKITEKRQATPQPARTRDVAGSLSRAERSVLIALAQRAPRSTTRNQVGILGGYSTKSSHLDNIISSLRTKKFLEGPGSAIHITADGMTALGSYEALPSGQELVQWWSAKVSSAERTILQKLVSHYPHRLSRQEVAEATGYSSTSSHLDNVLSRLRTLELIEGRGDGMKASDIFFE